MKYVQITVDGEIVEYDDVTPDTSYATIRNGVDGWIEPAPTDGSVEIYVNEEGKILGLPYNPLANALWEIVKAPGTIPGDYLAGDVVVTGPIDGEGESTGVPESLLTLLRSLLTVQVRTGVIQ